jgi:hypothetical protein
MEKVLMDMIAQAPAVAALLFLVFRLDSRIAELQAVIVDFVKSEQAAAHHASIKE